MNVVGARNLMLQYDCYHMQIMEGGGAIGLAATIERLLPRIGHIQFADAPGRNEPGTGTLDYPYLFAEIDRISAGGKYAGWVSAEYRPAAGRSTFETLAWFHDWQDAHPG
jgi:hydroxypyruvate isomerase